MSPARRSWRSIKRAYARKFPHHVLPLTAVGWRTHHTGYGCLSCKHYGQVDVTDPALSIDWLTASHGHLQ